MKKAIVVSVLLAGAGWALAQTPKERVYVDDKGRIRATPVNISPALNNPWPADWQEEFYTRADHAIRFFKDTKPSGNTWGENDKDSLPKNMLVFLNGDRAGALKAVQGEDAQAKSDHAHTAGIDYYWCFTIKGQMRKYFYFGEYLSPEYKQRMFDGGKAWTEQDPLRRPHPVYGKGDPTKGVWGPENKGSWVDVRSTDNLRAMRDISVYLMAEETGNKETAVKYKQNILNYVRMLYYVGMMEWDSETYMSHTMSGYHNLYDFAKDPEVKALGKAALDWLYAAGSVKYYRGGFTGPCARDYGGANVAFGANTSMPLWLYFGDSPITNPPADRDDIHHVTSDYRPPASVVELARKNFEKPVEIFATKPVYSLWTPPNPVQPRFFETTYIGRTFQMGSVVSEKFEETWDVNPFKMAVSNTKRGVDFLAITSNPHDGHGGKYQQDQIAQYRNLLIWLRPAQPVKWVQAPKDANIKELTFQLQIPKTAKLEEQNDIWFIAFENTFVAMRPIGLNKPAPFERAKDDRRSDAYRDEQFLRFGPTTHGDHLVGFALEVGEEGNYEQFKKDVIARSKLDTAQLKTGRASLTSLDGRTLEIIYNNENDLPQIVRDRTARNFTKEFDIYGTGAAGETPIRQAWQSGELTITAGGKTFKSKLTQDGKYTFENR